MDRRLEMATRCAAASRMKIECMRAALRVLREGHPAEQLEAAVTTALSALPVSEIACG